MLIIKLFFQIVHLWCAELISMQSTGYYFGYKIIHFILLKIADSTSFSLIESIHNCNTTYSTYSSGSHLPASGAEPA